MEALVAQTQQRLGPIDLLVCNAASNPYYGPMAGIADEQFRKIFDNNVLANHWLITMVAPEMYERREGAILVVLSIGGLVGTDVIGPYTVSNEADFQIGGNM